MVLYYKQAKFFMPGKGFFKKLALVFNHKAVKKTCKINKSFFDEISLD